MTIQLDPTTCKPDDVYRIRVGDRVFVGERVDPEDYLQWRLNRPASVWVRDVDVTVLHRLDVPMQPWDILREAESIARHLDGIERSSILAHANHLEREHRAAQEKAEQDAAREALIEKATEAYNAAAEAQASRAPLGSRDTAPWRDGIRAVIDVVLAEAAQP